jgi:hypothetical protein
MSDWAPDRIYLHLAEPYDGEPTWSDCWVNRGDVLYVRRDLCVDDRAAVSAVCWLEAAWAHLGGVRAKMTASEYTTLEAVFAEARRALGESESRRHLESVEVAAYGMYSVLCAGGTLTVDSPAVRRYAAAVDLLWSDEAEDALDGTPAQD